MDIKVTIGQRINSVLAAKNMKQKELAKALGVTDNTISYFCKGSRTPNLQQIVDISHILNVSTDYLLGIAPDPSRTPYAAHELGLDQAHIDILGLAAKINTQEISYDEDGNYLLSDAMKQLVPTLISSHFLEYFTAEEPISGRNEEHIIGLTAILYSRYLIQLVGDIINAVQQDGQILIDYDDIPTFGEIEAPRANKKLLLDVLNAGYGILPYRDFVRFKASEIGKAISRYLVERYIDGTHRED